MHPKYLVPLSAFLIFFFSCSPKSDTGPNDMGQKTIWKIYSKSVRDTFVISTQVPEDYYKDSNTKYPVVYLLDANFYFPMMAATLRQYEKAGLLPPLILVGIGYKTFELMDSLRQRDDLYPAALPSDEITSNGGAPKFFSFINAQVIPFIDSAFKTEKANRTLLGHSFAGYFVMYALLNQSESKQTTFKNFGAASPSLWYNKFYLNKLPQILRNRTTKDTLQIFTTAGGLEDPKWDLAPAKNLSDSVANIKDIKIRHKVYSELGHMDVPVISFIKALQEFYPINN